MPCSGVPHGGSRLLWPASTYVTVSHPIHGQHSARERTATANAVWNTQVLERNREAVARDKAMRDPSFEHIKKSALQCEFTLKWGRTMFGCPKCWLLPHFCVCNECTTVDTQTKVVLHLNQSEWCAFYIVVELSSRTSCVTYTKHKLRLRLPLPLRPPHPWGWFRHYQYVADSLSGNESAHTRSCQVQLCPRFLVGDTCTSSATVGIRDPISEISHATGHVHPV